MAKKVSHTVYDYTCDLCGASSKDDHSGFWANNFNGGACTIVEDGMNHKDLVNFENLCRGCRSEIQKAVEAVLVKRGGDKWWERRKKN